MDESELEARLRRRLHDRFDGRRAPSSLRAAVITRTTTQPAGARRRVSPSIVLAGSRQLVAALAVVVVVLVVAFALTGRQSSTGVPASPVSPTGSPVGSSPSPVSSAPGVSSVSPTTPLASVPPVSTTPWSALNFTQLAGVPEISIVVPWAGGYIAIQGSNSSGQLGSWLSRDGRTWTKLPADTFGLDDPSHNTQVIGGAACRSGALIASEDWLGNVTLWFSTDGGTWIQNRLPGTLVPAPQTFIAGSTAGAIIAAESGPRLDDTTDCSTWQQVDLAGPASTRISAVAAFRTGYVALDASSPDPGSQPRAWWSADGVAWSPAGVNVAPGDDFQSVSTGIGGLLARSHSGGAPGATTLWSSTNGRAWIRDGAADPFGVRRSGEGVGDPAGAIVGDGVRFLAFGSTGDDGSKPFEYLASADGVHWTRLTVQGGVPARLAGAQQVFLLRDGVLVSGDAGTWFGSALRPAP